MMNLEIYNNSMNTLRFDLQIIASWIKPESKVLDLGCGEGDLLYYLKKNKNIIGKGIDCNEANVAKCIQRGLSVLQGDINEEVNDYPDNQFDYVILSQTLQQVYKPAEIIQALLRIGTKGIVSFPNFSHWNIRMRLFLTGLAPITKQLPYRWYDTPNIRVITIKDFKKFSREIGFKVLREAAINNYSKHVRNTVKFMPNLFATYGIFQIGKIKDKKLIKKR